MGKTVNEIRKEYAEARNEKIEPEQYAFFFQIIVRWNPSYRYPGWQIATKQEMKKIIKNYFLDGFKIKIEITKQLSYTMTKAINELRELMQNVSDHS